MRTVRVVVVIVLVAGGAALAGGLAYAGGSKPAKPLISNLVATPATVSSGGATTVSASVSGANECALSSNKPVAGLPVTFSCQSGAVEHKLTMPTDTGKKPVKYKLTLTAIGVAGKAKAKTTVTVTAANFMIEKRQRVEGEASYTESELAAKVGQKVEYEVIVTNTGNVPLKFAALKDSGCENVSPSGGTELDAGKSETFTCEHTLTIIGQYTNEASIEGNEGTSTRTSNTVTVKVQGASFTIETLQRLHGEPSYIKSELTAGVGHTVEYAVIVKNTGTLTLKFAALKDSGCENVSPSGGTELDAGKSETFTCEHTLTSTGQYTNEASIEGDEGTGAGTSNRVTVDIPCGCGGLTIEKLQKIEGEAFYTRSTLTGEIDQTVDYEIIVKNTGNVTLRFNPLSDANCTGISPSGEETVAPGQVQTYTCHHLLTEVGFYRNEASIEGNEDTGTETSNRVVVEVL